MSPAGGPRQPSGALPRPPSGGSGRSSGPGHGGPIVASGARSGRWGQYASALTTSPPRVELIARQVARLIEFLKNLTLPSHIAVFTPPGCLLRAPSNNGASVATTTQGVLPLQAGGVPVQPQEVAEYIASGIVELGASWVVKPAESAHQV